ncbi:MAG: 6-carboxytetrahydropterin synthase QueD [Candidatus Cloacimonetes bacterium]|jgi:6-pyruvoyltetrahydropterin/6-carboxytetrahydropterin synthase|nr:6-carboxytetrahydropterin synthase QueD [Candidatus Cloacimonadota bacterium]
MYKLNVTSNFSSAHKLDGYKGLCKNLHGHNWKVRIGIYCGKVDNIGMTIDYGEVKKYLNEVIMMLDHTYLNELEYFKGINPTSENIAKFIYHEMKRRINFPDCNIAEVEVWESDITSMVYFEE